MAKGELGAYATGVFVRGSRGGLGVVLLDVV